MGFKIAARTILHRGSELISSDGIAFYELIKNAFDAHSIIPGGWFFLSVLRNRLHNFLKKRDDILKLIS